LVADVAHHLLISVLV